MEQNNIMSELLLSTTMSNEWHADFQTKQLLLENKEIYVFENVCYKENAKIPMIEESAKLKIAKKLTSFGKKVVIKDCEPIILEVKKEFGILFDYEII
jgi:hypothetical protein